jgi:hypothetical protein
VNGKISALRWWLSCDRISLVRSGITEAACQLPLILQRRAVVESRGVGLRGWRVVIGLTDGCGRQPTSTKGALMTTAKGYENRN